MNDSRHMSATGALFALEEDGGDGDGDGAVGARTISSLTCEYRMNHAITKATTRHKRLKMVGMVSDAHRRGGSRRFRYSS